VHDDEAVVGVVPRGDDARDAHPVVGHHVCRVEERVEHLERARGHVRAKQLGHRGEIRREKARARAEALVPLHHPDGAADVQHEDPRPLFLHGGEMLPDRAHARRVAWTSLRRRLPRFRRRA